MTLREKLQEDLNAATRRRKAAVIRKKSLLDRAAIEQLDIDKAKADQDELVRLIAYLDAPVI